VSSLFSFFKAKSLSRFLCEKKAKKKKLIREISSKDFLRLRRVLFLSLSRKRERDRDCPSKQQQQQQQQQQRQ